MIRVLIDGHIFNAYPHGGIARFFREIMSRIAARPNISFSVLCDQRGLPHIPVHPNIQPLLFNQIRGRPSRLFEKLNSLRRRHFDYNVKGLQPHIFHSTYYTQPPFPGMKTVATVYDLIDYQFPFIQPNGEGFVARQGKVLSQADQIISISQATAEAARNAFGLEANKIEVVRLGASTNFIPSTDDENKLFRTTYTRDKPYFLFVGEPRYYKNLSGLMRAFAQAAEETQHLLVVGGHSTKSFESWYIDLAIQLNIVDKIVLVNHPSDEVLRQAYSAASAFVFPSLQEGFGIPLLEAMQCGTPVVASDIPVFREVCADAALYFDPYDSSQLADRLRQVVSPTQAKKLRELGNTRSLQFSWNRAAEKVEEIYLKLSSHHIL